MKKPCSGVIDNLSMTRLAVLEKNQLKNNNEEEAVAKITTQRVKAKREFDGQEYILTKINYTEEDAKSDEAWHKERGTETRILEEAGYWLVYTKIGRQV